MSHIQFLKTYVKDYRVGALFPSSQAVVQRVVRSLDPGAKHVIEYGAGDGAITAGLLEAISEDGKIVAIETNKHFLRKLEEINDPRLVVLCADVRDIVQDFSALNLPRIDAVVSGIPFSFFNKNLRNEILAKTAAAVSPSGQFIAYQHSPLIASALKTHFGSVSLGFEPRNIFPYFIMNARKNYAPTGISFPFQEMPGSCASSLPSNPDCSIMLPPGFEPGFQP